MTRETHHTGNRVGCVRIWIKRAARLPLQVVKKATEFDARISPMHR
jgi:hypothetical protein